jgi:chemotaxis protein CheC
MGKISLEQVSENYCDVLKEIGNIGAGNAMTALSQMLQCKIDMKVPQVKLLPFAEVGALRYLQFVCS